MVDYVSAEEAIDGNGLRLVMPKGAASPWSMAAKTMFEIKNLDYMAAPWIIGEPNDNYVKWSGYNSAPIVAWRKERPINRWVDILYLAERLAPNPALIPADVEEKELMIGVSHELCGERGIGWNRRLQLFRPMIESGAAPEGIHRMASKYGYRPGELEVADNELPKQLLAFTKRLKEQYARGRWFLVGDSLTAADIYFTAFMNLIDLLPKDKCPMDDAQRELFETGLDDNELQSAIDPILIEHRDNVFSGYFRDPMEF